MLNKYKGEQAKKYSKFADEDPEWLHIGKPLLKSLLKSHGGPNKKALDLGCGAGRSISLLKDVGFRENNITGVDISNELLSSAEKRFPKAKLIASNIADVELPKTSFDTILSVMVFHYLNTIQLERVLHNCSNWLRNGGRLVFMTLHPFRYAEKDIERYFHEGNRTEKTPWETEIEYFHKTISTYLNAVTKSGLVLSEVLEPSATKDIKRVDIKIWEKYSKPTRLCVLAYKK